jgi:EmrB/QacA subfamily drug resistance transporter
VLVLLCVAQFMVVLDITVANVALPAIGADLRFPRGDLQWVVTAYLLFTGGLLLLGGRAADVLGRRRVFLTGLAVFTAASLASGLAPSPAALVIARAAQGLGAAMLTPSALSIITTTYTGAQRAGALSAWGAIASAGAAAGVVLGGMLTTWFGWRAVFLINVPVGAIAGLLALRLVPTAPATARRRLDLPGAMSLVAGLVALVYALEGTSQHGWGSARTLVLLGAAAGLLATFAAIEPRTAWPLVPPATWRVRSLVAGAAVMLGATGIMAGTFFLNSLYLQDELGWSALASGIAFLPLVVAIGVAAHLAPHLLSHAGARAAALLGLLLIAGGALILAAAPGHADYATDLLPGFVVLGLGLGLVFPTASITAMADIPAERAGLVSGLMSTAHELGAALGVAVLAAVGSGGYGDGFRTAAGIAVGLALLALVTVPSVRPAPGASVPAH